MTTDSQQELLTEVDSKNNVIGPIARGVAHSSKDKFYRTIYVIIKNHDGKILLQRRSATKDLYPNCWDLSVGGHVEFGDNYIDTAVRELKEEVGIVVSQKGLAFMGEVLVRLPTSNEFFYIYEYTLAPSDNIMLSKDEVADSKWATIKQIKESIKNEPNLWYPRPIQVLEKLY